MTTITNGRGRPRKHDYDAAERTCNTCGEVKAVSAFPPNYTHKGYINVAGRCRECKAISRMFKEYGLTPEAYRALLDSQGHVCGICHSDFTGKKHIDHDHATGVVRGVLCHGCNVGLGMFKDNPEALRAAAAYLQR